MVVCVSARARVKVCMCVHAWVNVRACVRARASERASIVIGWYGGGSVRDSNSVRAMARGSTVGTMGVPSLVLGSRLAMPS